VPEAVDHCSQHLHHGNISFMPMCHWLTQCRCAPASFSSKGISAPGEVGSSVLVLFPPHVIKGRAGRGERVGKKKHPQYLWVILVVGVMNWLELSHFICSNSRLFEKTFLLLQLEKRFSFQVLYLRQIQD
jgi:hypothetical protein